MKKKVLASIMATLVATTALFGCGSTSTDSGKSETSSLQEKADGEDQKASEEGIAYNGEEATVTYWHTHSDAEEEVLTEQIIPEFEKRYPKIHIDAVRMPYDGLMQQIITGISGNTGPDLMRMDIIWVPELAKMGALEPVDDLEGFAELKEDKLNKDQYLIACEGPNPWSMAPLFNSLGGVYTNEDYTKASGYLDGEASIKAMETIVKWYDEGIIGPCMNGGKPDAANGLYDGQYLFSYQGPWFYANDDEEQIAKVEGGLLPAGSAGSLTVNGGEDLVIFNGSKVKDAAWVFAQFLMSDYAQTAQAVGGGHLVPTVKSVAESEEVKNTPYMDIYLKQLEGAVPRTPTPVWEKMSDKLTVAFTSCLLHEDEPASALKKAATEIDALLQDADK